MSLPDAKRLYEVIERTWPPVRCTPVGPWMIRHGGGGGSRVSAATCTGPVSAGDLQQAEAAMAEAGQPALFQIRFGDQPLDRLLAEAGYAVKDPVTLYAAPVEAVATQRPPPVTTFEVWPPLAVQAEIWAEGGIGPARLAVMERAPQPKTTILGRISDRPAGTAFVGMADDCAMIHALEIHRDFRRLGLARQMTVAAAFWAQQQGARYLTLVTTNANAGANALYTSLGMTVVGQYHYRIKEA